MRPIKKTGIDALTISGSGRRNGEVTKPSNFGSTSDANGRGDNFSPAPVARNSSWEVIACMEGAGPVGICRRRSAIVSSIHMFETHMNSRRLGDVSHKGGI